LWSVDVTTAKSKRLSEEAIAQYRREGYYFPIDVLDDGQVAEYRAMLETFETAQGHPLLGPQRNKSHLLFTWVDELMRNPTILDAVEDLIGPDILCWNTLFWIKEPRSGAFISWHQDANYWGLDNNELVSAWVALSPASVEAGCMRILPGTHLGEPMPHSDEYDAENMLTRGQSIVEGVDEDKAITMPLKSGQISLHNVRLAHASTPNLTDDRRIGLSIHYMPPHTQQIVGDWDSAALVRGEDKFGYFAAAPRPARDLDPEAVAFHERASLAVRGILFDGAERVRPTL